MMPHPGVMRTHPAATEEYRGAVRLTWSRAGSHKARDVHVHPVVMAHGAILAHRKNKSLSRQSP
jgi:hypothetical protein